MNRTVSATPTNSPSTSFSEHLKKQPYQDSLTFEEKSPSQFSSECGFDDACILEMDYFVKTLSDMKAKGVSADHIGSIITHQASKWLPDLYEGDIVEKCLTQFEESPESVTASWMKKRFIVETLVGVMPPEKDANIPCNFLLRLLRMANMVEVEASYREELEKRISWQLDEASLKELMIPSFSNTCVTLLDVELVIRLVKRFVSLDSEGAKSIASLVKVAKLVDSYLSEAAMDFNLSLNDFVTLAAALPSHARSTDDGMYRAIDTYLRAHPGLSKQEKKGLCRIIDSRKLTAEASLDAAQNERFPVRTVIQGLLSEQRKLNPHVDRKASLVRGTRSPRSDVNAQQLEIWKLKEDVSKLQIQCSAMQSQMERMEEKRKGFFKWKKFGMSKVKVRKILEQELEVNGR